MSVATLPPSSGGKKKAPKRRGPYLVAKLERGLFEERHTIAGTVRYRCRYQKASGVPAEVTLKATTRTEARAEASRLRAQVSDGMFVAPTKLTVKELWESWREEWEALIASGERRPQSMQNAEGRLKKWCWPRIENLKAADVRREHVLRILDDGRRAGLSSWSLDSLRDALSGLLQHGVDREILQRNVARGLPKRSRPKVTALRETYTPSAEEVDAIIDSAEDAYRVLLLALAETGLRDGEVRGLRWSSIDWESNRISVEWQLEKDGTTLAPLKTVGSRRFVPLTGRLRTALREHKIGSRYVADDDFIFTTSTGRGVAYVSVRRALKTAIKQAEIDHTGKRFGQHAFRHSYASRLLLAGVDVTRVSKLLGHAQVSLTLNTYSHVIEQRQSSDDGLLDTVERGLAAQGAAR